MTLLDLPSSLSVFVAGNPAPQGSIRYLGQSKAGRAILTGDCVRTKPWREDIRAALIDARGRPKTYLDGEVCLDMEFILPRPKSAPKKRRASADKRPDMDKLIRAVLDAITSAGVWRDDAQWCSGSPLKRIAEIGETPGCRISLKGL